MRSASIRFLLVGMAICLVTFSCSNDSTGEASKIWQAYVEAVRAGDTVAVKAMYTPESQEYFRFYPEEQERARMATYRLAQVTEVGTNVELHVVQAMGGQQTDRTYYMVRSGGRLLFQYPFLIFAKDWSVIKSTHFVIHKRLPSLSGEDSAATYWLRPDTAFLETTLSRIMSVTGVQPPERIDYYLCSSAQEAGQLCGIKGKALYCIGRCVIAASNAAAWEVAYAALAASPRPCNFLTWGTIGWASFELRPKGFQQQQTRSDEGIASQVNKLQTTPLGVLVRLPYDSLQAEQTWQLEWLTGGAVVRELLSRKGDDAFRTLYRSSATPDDFEGQLRAIYGLSLQDLQANLVARYGWAMPALAEAESAPLDTGAVSYYEIPPSSRDVPNTRTFRSQNCVVLIGSVWYKQIPQILGLCERSYEQISSDFDYDRTSSRPYFMMPNHSEYVDMAEKRADSTAVLINGSLLNGDIRQLSHRIRFYLTYYVLARVADKTGSRGTASLPYHQSWHDLGQAICSFEQPWGSYSPALLKHYFPTGRFFSLAETDTTTSYENIDASTVEYCVLVNLLVERYGRQVLAKIGRSYQVVPVPDLLEQVTGRPWREIEQQWFDRMRQLVSSS